MYISDSAFILLYSYGVTYMYLYSTSNTSLRLTELSEGLSTPEISINSLYSSIYLIVAVTGYQTGVKSAQATSKLLKPHA